MAFCCNVELLWLSAVMQLALDQDPLVCINFSPPTCSKVLYSNAIPEYPSEHINKITNEKTNYSPLLCLILKTSKQGGG